MISLAILKCLPRNPIWLVFYYFEVAHSIVIYIPKYAVGPSWGLNCDDSLRKHCKRMKQMLFNFIHNLLGNHMLCHLAWVFCNVSIGACFMKNFHTKTHRWEKLVAHDTKSIEVVRKSETSFFRNTKTSVRKCTREPGVPKSTVHKYWKERLRLTDCNLAVIFSARRRP